MWKRILRPRHCGGKSCVNFARATSLARAARNLFRVAVGVTAVVAVYAVAVPAVVWAMARLTWATRVSSPVPAASLTAVVTPLLTWFGALASTMWRRTERLAAGGGKVGPCAGGSAAAARARWSSSRWPPGSGSG